jgi:hypothetical protein
MDHNSIFCHLVSFLTDSRVENSDICLKLLDIIQPGITDDMFKVCRLKTKSISLLFISFSQFKKKAFLFR